MKWIGQHIWDFISRFRNKVYFEDLEGNNSTTALVVDSEGRVFTNTLSAVSGNGEAAKVRLPVRFDESGGISKGDPVYIKSYHGSTGPVIVAKADASSAAHMPAFGLADADYAHNADGYAISIGNLVDLDTSSYSVGDTLYVAAGGGLTTTKPATQANLIQNVGTVARSNANNGQIEVVATGRSNDVPNLNDGYIFHGDSNDQAVATRFSTLLPAQSLAAITLDGNDRPRMIVKGSALDDASGSAPSTPNASGSVHTILKGTGWFHTEDAGDRNNINSLPLNIYTGHGQGTDFDSSGDATLNNSTDVNSGALTLQSGDLKNTGSGDTTTGQVSIVSGDTIDNGSGSHTSGNILIRAGLASGTGDCTAGNVTIEQGYASSLSGTATHGTLKLGNALVATPVEVLNKLKVKSNVIQDEDGIDCITFDSSGNTTIANTLNATLTGNVTGNTSGSSGSCTGNAATATALTAGDKTINGDLTVSSGTSGEATLTIISDTDNNDENDNPFIVFTQDGGAINGYMGLTGDANKWPDGGTLTGATGNSLVLGTKGPTSSTNSQLFLTAGDAIRLTILNDGKVGIGTTTPSQALEVSGNIDLTGIVRSGISAIKILPSDFIADDVGRPAQIDDVASNKRFLKSHSTAKLYASIDIPLGFKATAVDVFGSGTSVMSVHVMSITSGSIAATIGNGSIGTTFNFSGTPIYGSSTDYLLIELAQASTEQVFGGAVTIAKI